MPYRVAVAETSLSVQKAVQMAFPEPDFKVFIFEDGGELVNALPGLRPDALLLGLSLPGKNGYEIARLLKTRDDLRRILLIVLRGTFEPVDHGQLSALSYDALVQKPFDSDKLAADIKEMIDRATGPATLPEEPEWEADSSPGKKISSEEPPVPASKPPSYSDYPGSGGEALAETGDFEGRIRSLIREEVLEAEREVEKRVRIRLLAELKEWMGKELQERIPRS